MTLGISIAAIGAALPAALRWLRVAQREHYLAGSTTRFAWRWWSLPGANRVLALVGLLAFALSFAYPAAGLVSIGVVAAGPLRLRTKGSTAPLSWTGRLRRLTAALAVALALLVAVGWMAGLPVPAVTGAVLAVPLLVDGVLWVMEPIERRLSHVFVARASQALSATGPLVVAITGSYGKTTTKAYVHRLLRESRTVVASPASFNNRMGLARTINEQLAPGTEIFVAEMGTYGRGEIADLCSWIPPDVAVITAIGPVHLERFGSLEAIVEAKAEILPRARTAVLNIDDPRLAELADRVSDHQTVIRCSVQEPTADVFVDAAGGGSVYLRGVRIGTLPGSEAFVSNAACAIGVAVAVGLPADRLRLPLADLPVAEHRQSVFESDGGYTVIDDTYNANPAGASRALELLCRLSGRHRRVLVTPGMVELGSLQRSANVAFAAQAADKATDIVVVGRTNRAALLQGARRGRASVMVVGCREEAVEWVRRNLSDGDVVLYENDLPDHYP